MKPTNLVKVYIAHPITRAPEFVTKWKSALKVSLSKAFGKVGTYLRIYDPAHYGIDNWDGWKSIVHTNVREIAHSDFVVAFLDVPSFGVMSEIVVANDLCIPTVGYSTLGYDKQSPWVKRYIVKVHTSVDEIAKCLVQQFTKRS